MADEPVRMAILGTHGIPARYGGFETFAEELSSRLVKSGVGVSVYCEAGDEAGPGTFKGIELIYLPAPKCGPLTTILFDLRCLWHARKRYDVVYMLGYGSSLFCMIPRLWGSRVWINMDGVEWARTKWGCVATAYLKFMEAIAMRVADRIVADSDEIRRYLYRRHHTGTPWTVIPYGAKITKERPDGRLLAEWDLKKDDYYLVVCRLEPENHVAEVMEGFGLSKSVHPLVIVGDHRSGTRYVKRLLSVRDRRIRFLGTVYDQEKLQALRYYCTAYLHGHSVGGTNPSLLEALGCGNIVIAHENPFNREVAGDLAYYFSKAGMIAGHLERIEAMPETEKRATRDKARKRISDRYTWESVTGKYLELLGRRIR